MAGSYFFSEMFAANPDHTLFIAFVRLPDLKRWRVTLYSDNLSINCAEIAKSFGGGGHRGAAGFVCEELPFVSQT